MVSTTLRDAPPLAWPALRRAGGVKLVYLDQKDWVHLAQADTGPRLRIDLAIQIGSAIEPVPHAHVQVTADRRPGAGPGLL